MATSTPEASNSGCGLLNTCFAEFGPEPGLGTGAGHDQAAGDRDHQRRNDRDQPVADGQDGVGLQGAAESMPCCRTPIRKPAMMLMPVMRMLAIASRWVKRDAPSIAP